MINAWQWEKSKAISFPACKSRLNFRVGGQFEIKILKLRLMNTTYFICILKKMNLSLLSFEKQQHFQSAAHEHDLFYIHFKKIEVEHAIIWKVATCQRITSKNTPTQWVNTWARDTVSRYWSAETPFWQLSINQNMGVQYQVAFSHTSQKVWD